MPFPACVLYGARFDPKPVKSDRLALGLLYATALALPMWAIILKLAGVY